MAKPLLTALALTFLLGCARSEPAIAEAPAVPSPITEEAAQPEPPAAPEAPAQVLEDPGPADEDPAAATAGDHSLLFFLNPRGRPCQMQDQILKDMGSALTDKAALQYVSVADPLAKPNLYKYGIRALPALILVDAEGNEVHRFSPGIQSSDTILAALN